jgi:glutathione S-transferase
VPFFIKPVTKGIANKIDSSFIGPNLKTHFDFLEGQLASSPDGGPFVCGKEVTGADFLLAFPLEMVLSMSVAEAANYPKMAAYVQACQKREAYQRAVSKLEEISGHQVAIPIESKTDSSEKRRSKLA